MCARGVGVASVCDNVVCLPPASFKTPTSKAVSFRDIHYEIHIKAYSTNELAKVCMRPPFA